MNRLPLLRLRAQVPLATWALAALLASPWALAQHNPAGHQHHPAAAASGPAASGDARQRVAFPAPMKEHTLTNMRDHLVALAEIQEALASGAFDRAAQTAEQRLGMGSLGAHGAHEVARFMPQGMQDVGSLMHRSASRFAIEAQNSAATGDLKPALAALARVTQACTACHAGYRLE
jgi:hypothetical protein